MKFYKLFFFIISFWTISSQVHAQSFNAKGILGINASQLQGDNLSGFNKIGLQAGIGIEYSFLKNTITTELLYNVKGSASTNDINSGSQRVATSLKYLQLPVLYNINSWYNEQTRHYHIGFHFGPFYSRLFDISSTNPGLSNFTDNFNKNDFGAVVGVQYRMIKSLALALRYDQSFTKIYTNEASGISGIVSYLVTMRLEYYF